jgi:hypothetical protein
LIGENWMIAALICASSLAALGQVFVSYCRGVLATSRKVELSERLLHVAGMASRTLEADDFERFLQLIRLCPEHEADRASVRAIAIYCGLLRALSQALGSMFPNMDTWTARERENCSHFAAVVLDRSISSNRRLFAQRASDHP